MTSKTLHLDNLTETASFAHLLARLAIPGDLICLSGDLGAGKTALTQQIAKGLEVPDNCYVTSPTFSILQEYPGRMPLYHFDFYRLKNCEEIEKIGFSDLLMEEGIFFIEWPEKAAELLPEEYFEVRIDIVNATHRNLNIKKIAKSEDSTCQN